MDRYSTFWFLVMLEGRAQNMTRGPGAIGIDGARLLALTAALLLGRGGALRNRDGSWRSETP